MGAQKPARSIARAEGKTAGGRQPTPRKLVGGRIANQNWRPVIGKAEVSAGRSKKKHGITTKDARDRRKKKFFEKKKKRRVTESPPLKKAGTDSGTELGVSPSKGLKSQGGHPCCKVKSGKSAGKEILGGAKTKGGKGGTKEAAAKSGKRSGERNQQFIC